MLPCDRCRSIADLKESNDSSRSKTYRWGTRARAEIGQNDMIGFLAGVYEEDQKEWVDQVEQVLQIRHYLDIRTYFSSSTPPHTTPVWGPEVTRTHHRLT